MRSSDSCRWHVPDRNQTRNPRYRRERLSRQPHDGYFHHGSVNQASACYLHGIYSRKPLLYVRWIITPAKSVGGNKKTFVEVGIKTTLPCRCFLLKHKRQQKDYTFERLVVGVDRTTAGEGTNFTQRRPLNLIVFELCAFFRWFWQASSIPLRLRNSDRIVLTCCGSASISLRSASSSSYPVHSCPGKFINRKNKA